MWLSAFKVSLLALAACLFFSANTGIGIDCTVARHLISGRVHDTQLIGSPEQLLIQSREDHNRLHSRRYS